MLFKTKFNKLAKAKPHTKSIHSILEFYEKQQFLDIIHHWRFYFSSPLFCAILSARPARCGATQSIHASPDDKRQGFISPTSEVACP
jgi:hypothetical protein